MAKSDIKEHTMSCKMKWWPHNWFCLRGLYWIFVALFYVTLLYTLYIVYLMSTTPMLSGASYWQSLLGFLANALSLMLGFLTIAAILKGLRKIAKAVVPCCCEAKKEEVVVSSLDNK